MYRIHILYITIRINHCTVSQYIKPSNDCCINIYNKYAYLALTVIEIYLLSYYNIYCEYIYRESIF